jgi:hypothetical protein
VRVCVRDDDQRLAEHTNLRKPRIRRNRDTGGRLGDCIFVWALGRFSMALATSSCRLDGLILALRYSAHGCHLELFTPAQPDPARRMED